MTIQLRALIDSWGWGWCPHCHERPCRRRQVVAVDVPFMVFRTSDGLVVRNIASDHPWPVAPLPKGT